MMTFNISHLSDLPRKDSIQLVLAGLIRHLSLDIHIEMETVSTPMIMTMGHSIDLNFTAKTTIDEAKNFAEIGLPFKIRLKAILQALVVGLPHSYPAWRWTIPIGGPKDMAFQPSLTVENLETIIIFSESTHIHNGEQSVWARGARFSVRGTQGT